MEEWLLSSSEGHEPMGACHVHKRILSFRRWCFLFLKYLTGAFPLSVVDEPQILRWMSWMNEVYP